MTDVNTSIVAAGIDVSKLSLDVAIYPGGASQHLDYSAEGLAELDRFLTAHKAQRVGFEATGGYEWKLLAHLRKQGRVAARFQPTQVKAFARSRLRRAKNDKLDAALIATFTASLTEMPALPDASHDGLTEHLTYIEQLEEQMARLKTMRESCRDPRFIKLHDADIKRLEKRHTTQLKEIVKAIEAVPALTGKRALLTSIPGIGERTAIAILVRLPEIGSISREQVASLAGLAPFDNDSGKKSGKRSIGGGRPRLRKSLFMAAFCATRWNKPLAAFYTKRRANSHNHVMAVIAVARKLIVLANAVVARGTPWEDRNITP